MFLLIISLPWIFSHRIRTWGEFGVIIGFLAIWLLFFMLREKLRVCRTRGWPITEGAITEISVRKIDGGLNGVDYWKVSFDYTYRVQQEHSGKYSFNCTSERMGNGAVAGLGGKAVCVHYKPSDESKVLLWEDEVWDIWWHTYWTLDKGETEAAAG